MLSLSGTHEAGPRSCCQPVCCGSSIREEAALDATRHTQRERGAQRRRALAADDTGARPGTQPQPPFRPASWALDKDSRLHGRLTRTREAQKRRRRRPRSESLQPGPSFLRASNRTDWWVPVIPSVARACASSGMRRRAPHQARNLSPAQARRDPSLSLGVTLCQGLLRPGLCVRQGKCHSEPFGFAQGRLREVYPPLAGIPYRPFSNPGRGPLAGAAWPRSGAAHCAAQLGVTSPVG